MKWIGQHIWDFISRFRSDVYLEAIDTSTETDMLVVDSAGKVTKRAIDAITVDVSDFMTNGADNRVLTATGTDAINAEANLTYTGETLFQTHTPTGSANFAYLIDTNDYLVTSHSTTSLSIDCQAAGVTGDGLTYIGKGIGINVEDYATNHANATSKLTGAFIAVGNHNAAGTAEIKGIETIIGSQTPSEAVGIYQNVVDGGTDLKFVSSADTGDYFSISTIEDGETTLATLENGGGSTAHLNLDADGDIVLDSASGVIKTGSTTFVNNSGVIQVATQGTIDHDSLANFVTAEHVDWAGASAGIIHSSNVSTLNQDTTGTAATVTGAAQTNITSLGTLTNLDVDNININGDTITASADLSIVATGNDIAVDTDNLVIESATSAKPVFELKNTTVDNTAPTLKFTNTNGGTDGDIGDYAGTIEFTGNDDGTPSEQIYGQIFVRQHVAVSDEESGDFTILVAAHDGDLNSAFRALGGSEDSEVDVTIANGTSSLTTVAGDLKVNGTPLVGWHGSSTRIKILPRDFVVNDGGRPVMIEDDSIGSNELFLFSVGNSDAFAYVPIPAGYKATHVRIYGNTSGENFYVYEGNIDSKTIVDIATGATAIGSEKTLGTELTSDTTNYLIIRVTSGGTTEEIHGGYVTIAQV